MAESRRTCPDMSFPIKIAPSRGGSGPLSNACFLRPTWVRYPNGVSIGSRVFAQLMSECHQTCWGAFLPLRIIPRSTQLSIPRGKWIGSAVFCTSHGRQSIFFTVGAPFPPKTPLPWDDLCPHVITWALPCPQPKQHVDLLAIFAQMTTMAAPSLPQNWPFAWGCWPPTNTWFRESTWVLNPNGISIGSAIFAGLTTVTDWQTDWQTPLFDL